MRKTKWPKEIQGDTIMYVLRTPEYAYLSMEFSRPSFLDTGPAHRTSTGYVERNWIIIITNSDDCNSWGS